MAADPAPPNEISEKPKASAPPLAVGARNWPSVMVAQRTKRFDIRGVSHDEAAEYTRSRDESWIAAASTPDGRSAHLRLDGKASVDLELAVFENDGDSVVQRWESVPAFEDVIRIDL